MTFKLSLCLLVTLFLTGCATVVPIGSPPPCPQWSDDAIAELGSAINDPLHPRPFLEQAIGRQLLHCMALDEMRDG